MDAFNGKSNSPAGNWTRVSHVTGADTIHYTTEDMCVRSLLTFKYFFHFKNVIFTSSWRDNIFVSFVSENFVSTTAMFFILHCFSLLIWSKQVNTQNQFWIKLKLCILLSDFDEFRIIKRCKFANIYSEILLKFLQIFCFSIWASTIKLATVAATYAMIYCRKCTHKILQTWSLFKTQHFYDTNKCALNLWVVGKNAIKISEDGIFCTKHKEEQWRAKIILLLTLPIKAVFRELETKMMS